MPRPPKKSDIVDERGSVSIGGDTGAPPTRTWNTSVGAYLAGRSHLDGVDALAAQMERKWGVGRLRLLVSAELREKFDRQRYKLNQAIWHGKSVEDVKVEAERMAKAWARLDEKATETGQEVVPHGVWEIPLADGSVAVLSRYGENDPYLVEDGRAKVVFTIDEIAKLIDSNRLVMTAKKTFPGSAVVATRWPSDPLDAFADSSRAIDAPLVDDDLPF